MAAVNEINKGMNDRRATYIEYAQAVPLAYAIDPDVCIGCGLCENTCLAKAVKYDDKEEEARVTVGSVILAPRGLIRQTLIFWDTANSRTW